MLSEFLQISDRISVAPVIHGSGDFAIEIRRIMLSHEFDCLAVPLPPSFQADVEAGVEQLPAISVVIQEEPAEFNLDSLDDDSAEAASRRASFVPIDPCQPVIAALRVALQERMPRAFIDLETDHFESRGHVFPDPYALKRVSIDRFAAATLPAARCCRRAAAAAARSLALWPLTHSLVILRAAVVEYLKQAEGRGELRIEDYNLAADQFAELCKADLWPKLLFGIIQSVADHEMNRVIDGAVTTFLARYGAEDAARNTA